MMKKVMIGLTMLGSLLNSVAAQTQIPGSDMDIHGCVGSAGFTWCATSDSCVRSWETPCPPIIDQPLIIDQPPVITDLCGDVMCDMQCDNGFRINEHGCSMCICNEGLFDGIPTGCVSWYDGCNTCSVVNGVTQVCSMMYCITNQAAYCLLYSDAGH